MILDDYKNVIYFSLPHILFKLILNNLQNLYKLDVEIHINPFSYLVIHD